MATIALDWDDVCVQWRHTFGLWLAQRIQAHVLHPVESRAYDFSDAYPGLALADLLRLILEFSLLPGFRHLPEVPGARSAILSLQQSGHRLVVTTAAGEHSQVIHARMAQVRDFGIEDVVILPLSASKAATWRKIGADLVIDDHSETPVLASASGIAYLLFSSPANQHIDVKPASRMRSWEEDFCKVANVLGSRPPQPLSSTSHWTFSP